MFFNTILPVVTGPTVGDHGEDEVDEQDAVVEPEGDEDYEPGPANSLVQSQDEEDEEHEADEPGEERPVEDGHPGSGPSAGVLWWFPGGRRAGSQGDRQEGTGRTLALLLWEPGAAPATLLKAAESRHWVAPASAGRAAKFKNKYSSRELSNAATTWRGVAQPVAKPNPRPASETFVSSA